MGERHTGDDFNGSARDESPASYPFTLFQHASLKPLPPVRVIPLCPVAVARGLHTGFMRGISGRCGCGGGQVV